MRRSHKLQKNTETTYLGISKSFNVIDVDITKKLVTATVFTLHQPVVVK